VPFKKKSKKNKKVNLGGPGVTKKTHGSVNRNMLKTRDKKRKDKINRTIVQSKKKARDENHS
jgi:hypothetical protein